jgi:hypothetical protein
MNTLLDIRNFIFTSGASDSSAGGHLAGWVASVRKSLEASARARSQRELLDLADRYSATEPELAKELRAAASGG